MDSKGRYADNIFVERLWRTIKQEEVYLREYQTLSLKLSISGTLTSYHDGCASPPQTL